MSLQKTTDLSGISHHYGLALEEIKLERSIKNMASLLLNPESAHKFQFLQSELARQEKQLKSLQALRQNKMP